MYLLDTNVVSNLRRSDKADARVLSWARGAGQEMSISVITVLELRIGALLLGRKDSAQARIYADWIDHQILPRFLNRILAVDLAVVELCAPLHVPDKRPDRDAWIAATALVHDLTVVTRNTHDFESTGVRLLNPWNHS